MSDRQRGEDDGGGRGRTREGAPPRRGGASTLSSVLGPLDVHKMPK